MAHGNGSGLHPMSFGPAAAVAAAAAAAAARIPPPSHQPPPAVNTSPFSPFPPMLYWPYPSPPISPGGGYFGGLAAANGLLAAAAAANAPAANGMGQPPPLSASPIPPLVRKYFR